ncbi:MAG TPA: hypothetical protein VNL71_22370 [Chloroflexota bacterium]|nr:hypothetical protein [Chloroflexota bacterium]
MPAYPPLSLDHLQRMTDDTGIIQHAFFAVPDPVHGYSVDDQARALMATVSHARLTGQARSPRSSFTYLSFLRLAANPDGSFHNFLSFDRRWLDDRGSDDSQGRVWWALAHAARYGVESGLSTAAAKLFDTTISAADRLGSPRSWANTIFGLYHRQKTAEYPSHAALLHELAGRLVALYESASDSDWLWFEPYLTYCNGSLPAALLLAYEITANPRYLSVGLGALDWLMGVLFSESGDLQIVGQDGWYPRGGTRAVFDQQCVDAQGTVEASLIAFRLTGEPRWRGHALAAFDWFHGRNVHGLALVDPATGGCYDGLTRTGLNLNMGAESIVCYLLAYLDLVEAGILTIEGAIVP